MTAHEPSPQRPLVLVVDDDQESAHMLARILDDNGYATCLALTSALALDAARASAPDLILLAAGRPGLNSYALCGELKRDPLTGEVPVILLGPTHGPYDSARAFAAGADDVLARPFVAEVLLARAQAHVAARHLRRQLQQSLSRLERETAGRKAAEAALHERELFLGSVSASLPNGFAFQAARAPGQPPCFIYVSNGVRRLLGISPEQAYADAEHIFARFLREDRLRFDAIAARASRGLTPFEFEGRTRPPGGPLRWIHLRVTPQHDGDRRVIWSGVATDITARKQTEETLRRRVDELESLNLLALGLTRHQDVVQGMAETGPILQLLFDAATITVWVRESASTRLRRLITIGAAEPGQHDDLPAEIGASVLAGPTVKVVALDAGAPLIGGQQRGRGAGGPRSALLVTLIAHGEPVGMLCISASRPEQLYLPSDVALAQTVGGLLASAVENARLFAQAQSLAAARERRRLARELHDSVSQALYAANRAAETIPVIWELDPDEGRERLNELRRFTQSALAEMQTLLVELHPRALVEAPLHRTLGLLVEALTAKDNLIVESELEPVPLLPPDVQVTLYRIAQEALSNISKHARATRVRLQLRPTPGPTDGQPWRGVITLKIEDDGRGFDLDQVDGGRMGLHSMRERSSEFGAELAVVSMPGEGTLVAVTWRGAATPEPGPSIAHQLAPADRHSQ